MCAAPNADYTDYHVPAGAYFPICIHAAVLWSMRIWLLCYEPDSMHNIYTCPCVILFMCILFWIWYCSVYVHTVNSICLQEVVSGLAIMISRKTCPVSRSWRNRSLVSQPIMGHKLPAPASPGGQALTVGAPNVSRASTRMQREMLRAPTA